MFLETARKKVFDRYPVLKEKPVILYCPTFRKDEADFEKAVYELVEKVDTEKYNLVVKLHPLSKYIEKGRNTLSFTFPEYNENKGLRLYVELVEKDDEKYSW